MKKIRLLFFVALISMFIYIPEVDAMQIFVQKSDGKNIILEVETSDTIEALKEKVYQFDNTFLPEYQRLFFKGGILEDGRTLGDYNIKTDDTIRLSYLINGEKVKVIFDANGGNFGNDDTYVVDDWYPELYDVLIVPKRAGYKFKGYFTEKTGGTKFEMILNEAGIENNSVFYAQWEENIDLQEEIINPNTEYDGNSGLIIFVISFIVLLIVLGIYENKKIKL